MSSEKNLYEILDVSPNASETAIKSAYRKLARKYHPDVNGGDAVCIKKFKEISEAYEILSDAEKKKNYDILRGFYKNDTYSADYQAKRNQANKAYKETQRETQRESQRDNFKTSNMDDGRAHDFSNVFSDILDGFKKTTTQRNKAYNTQQPQPVKGSDVFTDVTITISEAKNGTKRTINILHNEKCPNCEGRKFINGAKCPLCNGAGSQSIHKKLSVKIPPKVKHGSKIRIANEGNRGYNGGKNGDLYLNIKIQSNSIFKYEGLNILCTIPITPSEAVLGASINIPTTEGYISMKVLPKTQSGQKFRLSGEGLRQDGKVGDMIVTVNIELPKNLSEKEIELYKELDKLSKEDIRGNLFNGQ